MNDKVIEKLLNSDDPSVKFKVMLNVLGKSTEINEVKSIQEEIKSSQRVKKLLSERKDDGTIPFHPYSKWFGAHWILATLADIGYPSGDAPLKKVMRFVH